MDLIYIDLTMNSTSKKSIIICSHPSESSLPGGFLVRWPLLDNIPAGSSSINLCVCVVIFQMDQSWSKLTSRPAIYAHHAFIRPIEKKSKVGKDESFWGQTKWVLLMSIIILMLSIFLFKWIINNEIIILFFRAVHVLWREKLNGLPRRCSTSAI